MSDLLSSEIFPTSSGHGTIYAGAISLVGESRERPSGKQVRVMAMETRTHPEDLAIARLRSEFVGYRFWRAVRADGSLGEWVASLHDPAAGVDPTVMCPTAEELRVALVKEGERAELRARFR
ncbi:hypothetical protein E1287_39450 [Actinomadura sp. KC06]|uniref:hypothetical protein n=1 Tax=Actinomadura sp. KC06 TaxID=2530369 RepID=UPI0010507122|nr:hypothetical protein [Actinomadura sp. KC06]TDD22901.1 hypothetical protein E1287_39450 [Actinomadura sp. KC06]